MISNSHALSIAYVTQSSHTFYHVIRAMLCEEGIVVIILILQMRKLSSETNLSKVTQLVSGGGWSCTQV